MKTDSKLNASSSGIHPLRQHPSLLCASEGGGSLLEVEELSKTFLVWQCLYVWTMFSCGEVGQFERKDWMDVTMTRLCGFLDASSPAQVSLHISSPPVPTQQVKVAKTRRPSPVMFRAIFFSLHSLQYLPPFSTLQSHVSAPFSPSWYFATLQLA